MGKAELKITIDEDLLAQAVELGLDVNALTEAAVRAALRDNADEAKARRWASDNAEAIEANRERIERYGVFGEDLRTW
ncbi:type II toxin-antitoxin system CcdA family antitoxin [Phenylobacterium sp.]|uniref:type II toxin-antitoxin system CcdA family antitoxin n=1 Tax=Phenylobacterium sp. TaxID=1871053 RepID=UPI00289ABF4C|nr:type II toxin-antitoxin system CcdA family antitoxin [Phenylobacterium sp.]